MKFTLSCSCTQGISVRKPLDDQTIRVATSGASARSNSMPPSAKASSATGNMTSNGEGSTATKPLTAIQVHSTPRRSGSPVRMGSDLR
jgi:hypothetical protein